MTNTGLFFLLVLPFIGGFISLFLGRKDSLRKFLSLVILLLSFISSIYLATRPHFTWTGYLFSGHSFILELDNLSRLVLFFANLFGFLICLYSKDFMEGRRGYFSWLLWLIFFSNLEIMASDIIIFTLAWGGSITILFMLLDIGSRFSAKKAVVILGFSYLCFILGAVIYCYFTKSVKLSNGTSLVLGHPLCWTAFFLMIIGALAKSGCGPLHTWIPTASESAPATVMAILPASLDKLLGIYILSRICLDFFVLNSFITGLLLVTGSLTIVFAVLMALIQHDLRKLLSFHAISQVGYMVLGIGTGNPVGIIGAIFHMFNNSIYKSGLFLVGGAVGKKTGTFELDSMGGLVRYMPVTFLTASVLALSISGVPPFNGFASKWMIYQGALLGIASSGNVFLRLIYTFAVVAAMFGSALTLASFIKFIHAIFLGQENLKNTEGLKETSLAMLLPLLVLALLCVFIGVFSNIFISKFMAPAFSFELSLGGSWNSIFVSVVILFSLVCGFFLWNASRAKAVRADSLFVGGEVAYDRPLFPATEFYKTVEEMSGMRIVYRFLKSERLDIYNILTLKWLFGRKKAK